MVDESELQRVARLWRAMLDRVLEGAPAEPTGQTLFARLEAHLGADPLTLPVVTERWAPHEQADLQLAIERWLSDSGVEHELVGTPHPARRHHTLPEMLQFAREERGFLVGRPDWVRVPVSPDDTHACVSFGFYLVGSDRPMVLLLRGPDPQVGNHAVQLEVLCGDPDDSGRLVSELRRIAIELSPVRGQIVTLAPPDRPGGSAITFLRRPRLSREQLVLPEATLEAVERQVLGVASLRDRLRASGQHLKRGVLLYGPPGTGKTHTVRYLLGRSLGVTAVVLSGTAVRQVADACALARRHQPSAVVLEDVDLVAGDRSFGPPGSNPLLFEVLNQLDGLGDDVDVVFVLTTNRVEVLERALAERPGRVDEAVEIGPPDAVGRERLLRLYGARAGLADLDLTATVVATDGLTATFLRELVRRATITAALARPDEEPVRVRQGDLDVAVEQITARRAGLTRALLGDGRGITEPPGPYVEHGWFGPARAVPAPFRGARASGGADDDDAPAPPGWQDDD